MTHSKEQLAAADTVLSYTFTDILSYTSERLKSMEFKLFILNALPPAVQGMAEGMNGNENDMLLSVLDRFDTHAPERVRRTNAGELLNTKLPQGLVVVSPRGNIYNTNSYTPENLLTEIAAMLRLDLVTLDYFKAVTQMLGSKTPLPVVATRDLSTPGKDVNKKGMLSLQDLTITLNVQFMGELRGTLVHELSHFVSRANGIASAMKDGLADDAYNPFLTDLRGGWTTYKQSYASDDASENLNAWKDSKEEQQAELRSKIADLAPAIATYFNHNPEELEFFMKNINNKATLSRWARSNSNILSMLKHILGNRVNVGSIDPRILADIFVDNRFLLQKYMDTLRGASSNDTMRVLRNTVDALKRDEPLDWDEVLLCLETLSKRKPDAALGEFPWAVGINTLMDTIRETGSHDQLATMPDNVIKFIQEKNYTGRMLTNLGEAIKGALGAKMTPLASKLVDLAFKFIPTCESLSYWMDRNPAGMNFILKCMISKPKAFERLLQTGSQQDLTRFIMALTKYKDVVAAARKNGWIPPYLDSLIKSSMFNIG